MPICLQRVNCTMPYTVNWVKLWVKLNTSDTKQLFEKEWVDKVTMYKERHIFIISLLLLTKRQICVLTCL